MPVLQINLIFQKVCQILLEEDECILMVFFQFQPLYLDSHSTLYYDDAFVIILGTSLDRTSSAAEMCATTVPLFKVTVFLTDFLGPIPLI